MRSKLQLDVRHLNRWWRHLVNAYEVRQALCLLQVKLCDPCLSALKWFVYHARRYTSARLYFTILSTSQVASWAMLQIRDLNNALHSMTWTSQGTQGYG